MSKQKRESIKFRLVCHLLDWINQCQNVIFFILVRMFKRNNPNFMKWQHLNFFESFYRNHFVFHANGSWSWASQSIFSTHIVAILDENRCIRNWANAKQRKTLKKLHRLKIVFYVHLLRNFVHRFHGNLFCVRLRFFLLF